MRITVTCRDGKKRKIGLRASYSGIKSERQLRAVVAATIEGYRKRGWNAYADALEAKDIIEQLSLIGMVSN